MDVTDSGGTCVCTPSTPEDPICFTNPAFAACLSTLLMVLFANLPIGLTPGMGLNAYFTYTFVSFHGSKGIKYETALAAVFIDGILFVLLSMAGIRQWLA